MSSSLLPSPPFHIAILPFPQTALSYLRSSRPITDPFIPINHKPAYSEQSQSGQTHNDLYIKKAMKTADTFINSCIHTYIHTSYIHTFIPTFISTFIPTSDSTSRRHIKEKQTRLPGHNALWTAAQHCPNGGDNSSNFRWSIVGVKRYKATAFHNT
jgi:hypothetical protein